MKRRRGCRDDDSPSEEEAAARSAPLSPRHVSSCVLVRPDPDEKQRSPQRLGITGALPWLMKEAMQAVIWRGPARPVEAEAVGHGMC